VVLAEEGEVDGNGLQVHALVRDLGPADPLLGVVFQELAEVGRDPAIREEFLDKDVVVLGPLRHVAQQSQQLLQILHFTFRLHEGHKPLEEIFWQVLCISLLIVGLLLENTDFFKLVSEFLIFSYGRWLI
jgi:hypothetical protein